MSRLGPLVVAAAVRLLLLAVLFVAALGLGHLTGTDPLGLGLLLFALYVVVAAGWAFRDGRAGPFLRVASVWSLVAVGLGVVLPLGTAAMEGFDAGVLGRDVLSTVPFTLVLVGVPALLGAALGATLGSRRAVEH